MAIGYAWRALSSLEPFRFLHTGDLHLDSPVEGLSAEAPPEILAVLRHASTDAWRAIVRTAIEEAVDFVVVAGDVFEVASPSLLGQTRFRDGLAQLAAAGIPSFVVHGNHDPLDGRSWSPSLDFPPDVHRFGTAPGESVPVLRAGREIARIHGRSYPRAAVRENYAAEFRADPGAPFSIGLLHTNVGDRPGRRPHSFRGPPPVDRSARGSSQSPDLRAGPGLTRLGQSRTDAPGPESRARATSCVRRADRGCRG